MSTTQTAAPKITNAGTKPGRPHKLFVNIPVPRNETNALLAITVDSREQVNEMVRNALSAGGARATEPQDHGFMYSSSFYDPDGHHWDVFWMDPSVIQG